MKLEKLFESNHNSLYSLDGKRVPVTEQMIVPVKWSDVEPGDAGQYNEEFLASLRLALKSKEDKNEPVVIEPLFDKDDDDGLFTAAMKHTARRIKDCLSVIGFSIPEQLLNSADCFGTGTPAGTYMTELLEKHGQYVFFCRNSDAGPKKNVPESIVLYNM
jgi:hypothetical protein